MVEIRVRSVVQDHFSLLFDGCHSNLHTSYRVTISLLNRMVQDAMGGEHIFCAPYIKTFCCLVKGQNVNKLAQPILEKLEHYLEIYPSVCTGPTSFYYDIKAFTVLYHGLLEERAFHDIQAEMKPYVEVSSIINGVTTPPLSKAVKDIAFMS